jgi:hypothetical protein
MHGVHIILHINAYPGSKRNGYTLVYNNGANKKLFQLATHQQGGLQA